MNEMEKTQLLGMTPDELAAYLKALGQPAFRAKQVFSWLHQGAAFEQMSNLPKALRETLAETCTANPVAVLETIESKLDGTIKLLYRLPDGHVIEGVLMRYKYGNTLCLSTQVGCRMGCAFCASTLDDKETVASLISRYDLLALPIVDREHRLVGIVTVDDAMDVMEDEVTEDIEKMAAIVPTDKPYLKTGVLETWSKRIPWLLLLMVSATFTSTILGHFEGALSALPILTVFVPMLRDTGGNGGGQTSVTIIRSMSVGDIEPSDVLRILWKEFRVALLCGATVGTACFVKTMLVDFRLHFTCENVRVSLVVCATIATASLIAKLIGTLLPIGAKKIGFDPAVMASPFLTTIVDTLTLLVYFGIASLCLGI